MNTNDACTVTCFDDTEACVHQTFYSQHAMLSRTVAKLLQTAASSIQIIPDTRTLQIKQKPCLVSRCLVTKLQA